MGESGKNSLGWKIIPLPINLFTYSGETHIKRTIYPPHEIPNGRTRPIIYRDGSVAMIHKHGNVSTALLVP